MMPLKFHIIIPAHNEESHLERTLNSLVNQTISAEKIIIVNDNSMDATASIAQKFVEDYDYVSVISIQSSQDHLPGSKVVNAFNKGFETIKEDIDIICKFDADLIFPLNYLESIQSMFQEHPKLGIASGILHVKKGDVWVYENIADKTHVRGPVKAYRKACFDAIGGLKPTIGWDTVDVLLAKYHNWTIKTDVSLMVKHLKPTGATYKNKGFEKQGEAMFKMRYGLLITLIAALKISVLRKNLKVIFQYLKGYRQAKSSKQDYIVTVAEGQFIRKLRWQGILGKLKL